MYKISVIIPVYNAENTIKRTIDSILNQKWDGNITEDIEIILINDCSTDKSPEIIKQYSEKYSNIQYYSTKKNTGAPAKPRNIGIKHSNGEYLMFMDNDDKYCKDMCQKLYDAITQEKVDIAVCNYYHKIGNSEMKKSKIELNIESYEKKGEYIFLDSFNAMLLNSILPWTKILKKSLLIENNLFFPTSYPTVLLDDRFFFLELYSKINKMIFLKDYYGVTKYTGETSLSAIPNKDILINALDASSDLHKKADSYIDFNKNPKYKFNFSKEIIANFLFRMIFLEKTKEIKICLKAMSNFERKIEFDNSLDDKLLKIINHFVLKKHILTATTLMKFSKICYKSDLIKKIWRIVLKKA